MKNLTIRYKFIEHERTEDAPFVGALISAVGCKFKCKGCFNRDLKKMETKKATATEIIEEVLSNPFNQGIILAGLEWSEQPTELVELCEVASSKGLQIMIYTGCESLGEFDMRIGKACADLIGVKELPKERYDLDMMYSAIGGMVLDHVITTDYYIKVGRFDREKVVEGREAFGVKLATENQTVIKIQKVEE